MPLTDVVSLRAAQAADIPQLVRFLLDPEAAYVAAFVTLASAETHAARWQEIMSNPDNTVLAIMWNDQMVGSAGTFLRDGDRELTYWIDRPFWRRGIATRAVAELLRYERVRPLFGRVASDNAGSVRVLEKSGFVQVGREVAHAPARGRDVEELIFRLDRSDDGDDHR